MVRFRSSQTIASADIRSEIHRVLGHRGDAIVSESLAIFPSGLGRRLLSLLSAAIEGRLDAESDGEPVLPVQRLTDLVYLMERMVLTEIALDPAIGATSDRWETIAQTIRKASFDVLAACWARTQQEQAVPAIVDKLTTLYSRAMLDVVLSTEVQRSERFSFPIALLVFDVDRLAELNRLYGSGVGDRLLERLGILIRQFFRQEDWVFRHGGDSIAVLLPQVPAGEALTLASRVVATVEQRLGFRDHDTGKRVQVTLSAAAVTGQGSLGEPFDAERLLLEAATAMQRAKALGGNRVEQMIIAPVSLSVQSAAHYLQCSPAVVQKLIAQGKLKTTGSGARLRIHRLAVEDYRSAKLLN